MKCPGEVKELLKVLYGLTGSEAGLLYWLCENEGTASEIAEELDRDRSTVQRYLSRLRSTGLVERESRVEDGKKGRFYVYQVSDKDELRDKVEERLEDWEADKLEALRQM
jgi:predicted transcriptional regulator